jgi:hypothetical protein
MTRHAIGGTVAPTDNERPDVLAAGAEDGTDSAAADVRPPHGEARRRAARRWEYEYTHPQPAERFE